MSRISSFLTGYPALLLVLLPLGSAAADFKYIVTTESTVRQAGVVLAGGITWQCKGTGCVTVGPWPEPDVKACYALARLVGFISHYGHDQGRALDEKGIAECNSGLSRTLPPGAALQSGPLSNETRRAAASAAAPAISSGGQTVTSPNRVTARPSPVCLDPEDCDGDGYLSIAHGGGDCDDNDPHRFPTNTEICDFEGYDEDCNPYTFGDTDQDGDGFISDRCMNEGGGSGPFGRMSGNDCNDQYASINPAAPDVCDGIDNDCDGSIDENTSIRQWPDRDGDLFGDGSRSHEMHCPGTAGYSPLNTDCDDANPAVGPGDVVCTGGGSSPDVLICINGRFEKHRCAAGTACVVQPNGTGSCQRF